MSMLAKDITSDLSEWLAKQPRWLNNAAIDLLNGKSAGDDEIQAFANLALSEVVGTLVELESLPALDSLGSHSGESVSLVSISEVSGVGQLKPRNPLKFGIENIVVVFGSNGSGKSSYVRILKHACGARQKGEIHPNVFDTATAPQSSILTFRTDLGEQTAQWNVTKGGIPKLSTIDIFDTVCGHSYLAAEGQPTYEPRILVFLSELATLCEKVAAKLVAAITTKTKALPSLPPEHASTSAGKWYGALTSQTQQVVIDENCAWSAADDDELAGLGKYLSERSPKDRAREFDTKRAFIDGLATTLREHCAVFSDDACRALMALRQTELEKQQTAELAAKVSLQSAVLEGVGTQQWLDLWEIARTYSSANAYPRQAYPNLGDDARCVLCHQELSLEAKQRLKSFDDYVANEASTTAMAAKASLDKSIKALAAFPDDETLDAKGASAGLDENSVKSLKGFYVILRARRALLVAGPIVEQFGEFPDITRWMSGVQVMADECAVQSKQFLDGFSEEDRKAKAARQNELLARKWIHNQKVAVEAEVQRLAQMETLTKAKDLCSTRAISIKKSALSEVLITPTYISSFNSELKSLGARKVKVELAKTRVDRGAVLHQVRLQNAALNKPIQDVLSEGEHRIVCIAAFLADVGSKPNRSTFVFDDPISSLDLDYEEAVVQRLVALSSTRQVVVFTHRLSLLGMVQDYSKKADVPVRVVQIRKEPWGAGEPGDEAIEAAKPKVVLNEHMPRRIANAKDVFEKEGDAAYRLHAQSICTETRKLIERMIELELLADVIQRHRRAINTLGKLEKLADIKPDDCKLLDAMMTKYSRYEHAQSAVSQVDMFPPDVVRVNANFDEQKIDPVTKFAQPDYVDEDLKAASGPMVGKIITTDLSEAFFGYNPNDTFPDGLFDGATVTIEKLPAIDADTGNPESGNVRFYVTQGLGSAAEQFWAIPLNDKTTGGGVKTKDLVPLLYAANPTIPKGDGVQYWIEGIAPGPITLQFNVSKSGSPVLQKQVKFLVCTQQRATTIINPFSDSYKFHTLTVVFRGVFVVSARNKPGPEGLLRSSKGAVPG